MSGRALRILVADDEPSIRFVLREAFEDAGHEVVEADSGHNALDSLERDRFDMAVLDIRMPGPSGLELLDRVRGLDADTAVVVITAENTFENAVEAMKRGALDYLVKPFRMAEVVGLADKARRASALQQELRSLRRAVGREAVSGDTLVGTSPSLLEIFKTVGKVAGSDVPVLITGESGTGKELVARAIHGASPRATGPFVPVNSAAIPRDLLESELFGHERGAFTGATESRPGRFREAAGGTLFLDEIGDMPLELQAKLLRVLQSKEVTAVGGRRPEHVDVRILAATHRQVDEEVQAGRFREDLLYRLRVVPIHIPALRERREDIPVLARHFLSRYARELGSRAHHMGDAALERLERYDWPGNVRELENAIKRALVLAAGEVLTTEDFRFLDEDAAGSRGTHRGGEAPASLLAAWAESALETAPGDAFRQVLAGVEKPLIEAALTRTAGNQLKAASLLGINRNTLRKKIAELGVQVPGRE